jgi:hypothetical protein
METKKTNGRLLLRAVSCVLSTFILAWLVHANNARLLAKMDAMTPAEFVANQKHVFSQSYLTTYIVGLLAGAIYLGAVELIASLLGSGAQKPNNA